MAKNLNVRFEDEDLHQRIRDAAAEDRRSVNSEILWIIERGLAQRSARNPYPYSSKPDDIDITPLGWEELAAADAMALIAAGAARAAAPDTEESQP